MKADVIRILVGSVLALGLGLVSTAARPQAKVEQGVLTSPNGMTLYTFDKDTTGKSACTGNCEKLWPPLEAKGSSTASTGSSGSKDYTVIQRDDGTRQWAYKGKPLYTFSRDKKPGDETGNNFANGAWHVAKP